MVETLSFQLLVIIFEVIRLKNCLIWHSSYEITSILNTAFNVLLSDLLILWMQLCCWYFWEGGRVSHLERLKQNRIDVRVKQPSNLSIAWRSPKIALDELGTSVYSSTWNEWRPQLAVTCQGVRCCNFPFSSFGYTFDSRDLEESLTKKSTVGILATSWRKLWLQYWNWTLLLFLHVLWSSGDDSL